MGVAYRLSERDWLYYCIFLEMAIELHGGQEWAFVEPVLAPAWQRGCCSVPWEDVSLLMRTHWSRRGRCRNMRHAGAADTIGSTVGTQDEAFWPAPTPLRPSLQPDCAFRADGFGRRPSSTRIAG